MRSADFADFKRFVIRSQRSFSAHCAGEVNGGEAKSAEPEHGHSRARITLSIIPAGGEVLVLLQPSLLPPVTRLGYKADE